MKNRLVYLVNPKTNSLTTRPIYMNRALYSPLAGLLAVASLIPRNKYEVLLVDENIEDIDLDINPALVGISAMTSFVNRGYEIADEFRRRNVPVVMGGVHPSFMPHEALQHADAVVVGEAELIMDRLLQDLEDGRMKGMYKADRLCPMERMPLPRYDLIKRERYVNKAFIQTSRGCHQGCTFCAESLMNGLKFRYRPIDEVIREIETCGQSRISINDADFFGTRERPKKIMKALKGRGFKWQAGVTSRLAGDDEMLEMAAESGCFLMSIGFESINRNTLKSVHKVVNHPDRFAELVDKIHSYGIMVFGLFMFGFDSDEKDVFETTARFNVDAGFDMCAYSVLTPYPGTLTWYEMKKQGRMVSYDWDRYDQSSIVYKPVCMPPEELSAGHRRASRIFYSWPNMLKRLPRGDGRSFTQWSIYNLFMKKGSRGDGKDRLAQATEEPRYAPMPPILPKKAEWREAILEDYQRMKNN